MECKGCGRYSPPDPATGYDGDDLCPWCRAELDEIQCDNQEDEEFMESNKAIEDKLKEMGFTILGPADIELITQKKKDKE